MVSVGFSVACPGQCAVHAAARVPRRSGRWRLERLECVQPPRWHTAAPACPAQHLLISCAAISLHLQVAAPRVQQPAAGGPKPARSDPLEASLASPQVRCAAPAEPWTTIWGQPFACSLLCLSFPCSCVIRASQWPVLGLLPIPSPLPPLSAVRCHFPLHLLACSTASLTCTACFAGPPFHLQGSASLDQYAPMLPSDPVQQLPLLPAPHTAATSRVAAWLLQHQSDEAASANNAAGMRVPVEAAVPGHDDCDSGDDCADLALLHLHDSLDEAATEVRCCRLLPVSLWVGELGLEASKAALLPALHGCDAARLMGCTCSRGGSCRYACLFPPPALPDRRCLHADVHQSPMPLPFFCAGGPGGRGLRWLPLYQLL